jgi:hypothetical protein
VQIKGSHSEHTLRAGTAHSFGEFFYAVRVAQSLFFCVMLVNLTFFIWLVYFLSFEFVDKRSQFHCRITPLSVNKCSQFIVQPQLSCQ